VVVVSSSQLVELDQQKDQEFSQRLAAYLQDQAPDFVGKILPLIDQARSNGLLTERQIAMFALFAARAGETPIHPERCTPKGDQERIQQFRLRFEDELSGWMAENGIDAI